MVMSDMGLGSEINKNPKLSDSNTNLVLGPRWVIDTKTDWMTACQS
jgi:hypothetical protein